MGRDGFLLSGIWKKMIFFKNLDPQESWEKHIDGGRERFGPPTSIVIKTFDPLLLKWSDR